MHDFWILKEKITYGRETLSNNIGGCNSRASISLNDPSVDISHFDRTTKEWLLPLQSFRKPDSSYCSEQNAAVT